ncbi:hypothetical protein [Fischerella sp. PCC 9605]|nr:hypothetical protein [Fischerella sp. PCC 9605]
MGEWRSGGVEEWESGRGGDEEMGGVGVLTTNHQPPTNNQQPLTTNY